MGTNLFIPRLEVSDECKILDRVPHHPQRHRDPQRLHQLGIVN